MIIGQPFVVTRAGVPIFSAWFSELTIDETGKALILYHENGYLFGSRIAGPAMSGDVLSPSAGQYSWSTAAPQTDDRSVVIWSNSNGDTLRARFLGSDGVWHGSDFVVATPSSPGFAFDPKVAALRDGGFIAGWSQYNGSSTELRYRSFTADGVGQTEFVLDAESASDLQLATLSGGNVVAVWRDASDIHYAILQPDGQVLRPESDLPSQITGWEYQPDLATLEDNRFVAVWFQGGAGPADIRLKIFGHTGLAHTLDIVVDTAGSIGRYGNQPAVAAVPGDRILVAWVESLEGSRDVIRGQLVDANGNFDGTQFDIATSTGGTYVLELEVGGFADGRFLVTWGELLSSGQIGPTRSVFVDPRTEAIDFVGTSSDDVAIGTVFDDTMSGGEGADRLYGQRGNDDLSGLEGADILSGGVGNDELWGGVGNDTLDGGAGFDDLYGGAGDDIYILRYDNADAVNEVVAGVDSGGVDLVKSFHSFVLPEAVENLQLLGTSDIDGEGNDQGNRIIGNSGTNILYGHGGADLLKGGDGDDALWGGAGRDVLVGGAGADNFFILLEPDATIDRVADFQSGVDFVTLHASDFGMAAIGGSGVRLDKIAPDLFVAGPRATAHHGQFLYNQATGLLRWDTDGIGGAAPVRVASFDAGTALDAHDFLVL